MSEETAEQTRGRRRTVALSNLYLDPNNFRFVDRREYRAVPSERVFEAEVQRRTTSFVLGRQQENVRDLVASIRANGWLDIDPILVQRTETGRFLVVEGNRRVATLRYLQRRHEEGDIDLGKLDPGLFSELPVNLYRETDERSRLVMMGLHHISGKRRWPAINRARAMERLLPHFGNDAQAVCEALGVTKREFNLSVRNAGLGEGLRRERLRRPVAARSVQPVSRGSQERESAGLDRLGPRRSRGFQPVEPQPTLLVDVERSRIR